MVNTKKTSKKNNHEVELTVKLPKEWVDHLIYLEKTTSKNKDYYIKESLSRHLESLQELQIGLDRLKSKSRTYTTEELNKKLGL